MADPIDQSSTLLENAEDQEGLCTVCGDPAIEPEYAVNMCKPCRDKLVHRPVPLWIMGAAVVVLIALVAAFISFPASLKAGVAFERGQRAEAAGKYALATVQYRQVVHSYPDSTNALIRYGIAAYHAGDYSDAADAFDKLSGREISSDQADEVNPVINDLQKKIQGATGQ